MPKLPCLTGFLCRTRYNCSWVHCYYGRSSNNYCTINISGSENAKLREKVCPAHMGFSRSLFLYIPPCPRASALKDVVPPCLYVRTFPVYIIPIPFFFWSSRSKNKTEHPSCLPTRWLYIEWMQKSLARKNTLSTSGFLEKKQSWEITARVVYASAYTLYMYTGGYFRMVEWTGVFCRGGFWSKGGQ